MQARANWPFALLCILANLLIPVAILTFAIGFFPYKPFLPGTNQFDATGKHSTPDAPFNKVIFMIVDALRRYENHVQGSVLCLRLQ